MESIQDEKLLEHEKLLLLRHLASLEPKDQNSWHFIKLMYLGRRTQLFQNLDATNATDLLFLEAVNLFFEVAKSKPDLVTPSSAVKALIDRNSEVSKEIYGVEKLSLEKVIADLRQKMKNDFIKSSAAEIVDLVLDQRDTNPDLVLKQLDKMRDSLKALDQGHAVEYHFGKGSSESFGSWEGERRFASPIPGLLNFLGTKRLYVFAGAWGEGKTHLAINVSSALYEQGLNVLHITLEIPLQETLVRYIGQSEGMLLDDVMDLPAEKLREKLANMNGKSTGSLVIQDIAELSPITLKSYLLGRNFDVVIIDYIDLMDSGKFRDDSLFQTYGQIARDLYSLAKELSICVIAMTQLNRAGADSDNPSATHLSRSIGKAEAADGVVIMKLTEKNNQPFLKLKSDKLRHWKQKQVVYVPIDYARGKVYLEQSVNMQEWTRSSAKSEVDKDTDLLQENKELE